MKSAKLFITLCFFLPAFLLPAACLSGGRGEGDSSAGNNAGGIGQGTPAEPGESGTITGKISVKGSEPKTFVALTTEDGTVYEITGPLKERLQEEYQYKTVTLEGELLRTSSGPGMSAQFRAEQIVGGQ